MEGVSYSRLMHMLKEKNVDLNRKVLADMAMNHADAFKAIVNSVR
jgi:large subunit ribosomal protein L20